MDHQEVLGNFVSITGTVPEIAEPYLRLADYSLEEAVNLFFANDGAPLPQEQPAVSAQSAPSRRPAGYQDEDGVVHLDSDDNISDDNDPEITGYNPRAAAGGSAARGGTTFEDDAAMARRLQEEMYGAGGAGGAEEDIRAPMARTTETLIGPGGFDDGDDDMHQAIFSRVQAQSRAARSNGRPGIFNQRDMSTSIWNDREAALSPQERLSRATGGASDASSRSNLLAEMFRPPFEIITRLPFDVARDEGREKEKWILVDVQNPAVFDCQVLNRDVWKHPGIVETVKENFLFLQYNKDDPSGAQYVQYYFQNYQNDDFYPHIAIIDPRTGEQVKVWSGPPGQKPLEFLGQLHEFLDRYSLDADARNPVAKRKPDVKPESRLDAMTEEEQFEWAMRNSLAEPESSAAAGANDPDDLTRSVGDVGQISTSHLASEDAEMPSTEASPFSLIPADKPHTEPAADPATTTRIQFRHSGGRVIRRFAIDDPVQRIYEWLKASPISDKQGVDFELVSLGKNLMEVRDSTIADAGLKNGTVMIEFIEDE